MLWIAGSGMVNKSWNEVVPPWPTGYGATRRPSISTRVASGVNPRNETEAAPGVKPVLLFETGTPLLLAIGKSRNNSAAWRSPDFSIKSRLMANTGLGPTSSAVGMFEPVTITRSASAAPVVGAPAAGAAAAGAAAAPVLVWPNALVAIMRGNPIAATQAKRKNPNVFSTFLVIGFSIGLVRFGPGIS